MFRINTSKVFLYSLLAPKVVFYFLLLVLVDLGPGAAVSGVRIEINSVHSRYMISNNSRRCFPLDVIPYSSCWHNSFLKCRFFCLSGLNKKRITMLFFFVEQKENRRVPGFVQSQIGRNSIQARSHPCFHFFVECSDNCLGMLHCSFPPVDFLKIIILRFR